MFWLQPPTEMTTAGGPPIASKNYNNQLHIYRSGTCYALHSALRAPFAEPCFRIPCNSLHPHAAAFGACRRLDWRLALLICTFGGKSGGMVVNAHCWSDISAWRCPAVWGVLAWQQTFYNSKHPILLQGGAASSVAWKASLTCSPSFDRSFRIARTASMSRHLQKEKAKCRASGRRQRNPCWR